MTKYNYLSFSIGHPLIEEDKKTFFKLEDDDKKKFLSEEYVYFKSKPSFEMNELLSKREFYFTKKSKHNTYAKSLAIQFWQESYKKLINAQRFLNPTLYSLVEKILFLLHQIMSTNAWNNNKFKEQEYTYLNYLLNNIDDVVPCLYYVEDYWGLEKKNFRVIESHDLYRGDKSFSKNHFSGNNNILLFFDEYYNEIQELECAIHMLIDVILSMKVEKSYSDVINIDYDKGETDDKSHEDLIHISRYLIGLLSYTIHSTSWQHNELLPFDELDLDRKMQHIPNIRDKSYLSFQ